MPPPTDTGQLRCRRQLSKLIVRIILSDGNHFIQGMLATQLNHLVDDHTLDKNTVVKLKQFVTNAVQGRKSVF